ncbi:hypothetical protein ACVH9Z_15030 [Rhodococcus opacus]|jgi:hypothetical protein|uniref:Uncharacterized protein n=4 Tax=Rhodococcus TaxID=1827 RepID=A0A076EJS5_RHOOP|nr:MULTISPECIES: hypothetical protein [Rhodococcus]ELB94171.1 hypothetical protein Rwratislav_05203 [Rhodococcus wratislaviensis IFP 2016]NDV09605.1 hypothetical protein [Rhodococcus sp. IEGM 248]ABG96876.1 conserved hypothetical protein [Rhodococcus jostii RHA1]AII05971.1 hypothetical protein EP51_15750 [Rhodococcus opacus]EJI96629.1 hypothetical protein JVH1_6406 [Rhodococcus sp. JVH1]
MDIMRKVAVGAVAVAGLSFFAAGTAAADPVPAPMPPPLPAPMPVPLPAGTYLGTTNVLGGDLIWKGKTFGPGWVMDNFGVFFPYIFGMTTPEASGSLVTDYSPSGLPFLTDRITPRPDGTYEGTVYINGNPVAGYALHK